MDSRMFLAPFDQWNLRGGAPELDGTLVVAGTMDAPMVQVPGWVRRARIIPHPNQPEPIPIFYAHGFTPGGSLVINLPVDPAQGVAIPMGTSRIRIFVGYYASQQGRILHPGIEILFTAS